MKKVRLLTFLLFIFSGIHPQEITNIDSAKRVLQTAKDDTAKVNLLHRINSFYLASNQDSAFIYMEQEYHLAEKINYQKGKANACLGLSYYNGQLGNAARTLEY